MKLMGFVIVWSVFFNACQKTAAPEPVFKGEIVIGMVDAFSGYRPQFPLSSRNGIFLKLDEINAKGGVAHKKIVVKVEDDQGNAEQTAVLAQKLIEQDQVVSILGASASSRSLKLAPVAQKLQVPMVSPSSTHPDVTKVGEYVFRACFVDSFQGEVMAKFLFESGVRKVAILKDTSTPYSLGLAAFFKKHFEPLGGKIVEDAGFKGGEVNFKTVLNKISEAKPEVVYIPTFYTDAVQIVLQAKQLGKKLQFAGGDGWDSSELLKLGREGFEGSFFTSHFSNQNPDENFLIFKKKYQAKYNKDPDAFAALGYDAAGVLLEAIARTQNQTPKEIRDELSKTQNYKGATGKITFEKDRNPIKPAVILQVKDGKISFVKTVEP